MPMMCLLQQMLTSFDFPRTPQGGHVSGAVVPHILERNGRHMEMIQILTDVAQARAELADLALTDVDPARLDLCDACIGCLENELEITIVRPWIPATYPEVQSAISATMQNIEQVEEWIVEATVPMLENKIPEEMWRFHIARLSLEALRFQLDVLFEVAAALIMPPQTYVD